LQRDSKAHGEEAKRLLVSIVKNRQTLNYELGHLFFKTEKVGISKSIPNNEREVKN